MFFYRTIPPKWLKCIARLTARKHLNLRFVHLSSSSSLSSLRDFFKWSTSIRAKAITVVFARISFNLVCVVPFTTRMFVPLQFDLVEAAWSFQHYTNVGRHCTITVPRDIVCDVIP